MSSNLSRLGIVLGGLGALAGFASSVIAGCGSNGTAPSAPSDSGVDATAEASTDARSDTGADVMADTSADGGADADGSPITDTGPGFVDVGDVAIDVPPLAEFPSAVDQAYCTRLQQCCLLTPSQWKQTECASAVDQGGGIVGIAAYNAALDSGLLTYDASAAHTCLEYVLSFTCGTVPATALNQVRSLCFGVMQGTVAANGACASPLECQPGLYCQLGADGGPGVCAALKTQGQSCRDTIFSTECTYLGNGSPPFYCDDPGEGGTPTCQPALGVDAGCSVASQCQTLDCNYPVCSNTFIFSDPGEPKGTCAYFTILDAGGD